MADAVTVPTGVDRDLRKASEFATGLLERCRVHHIYSNRIAQKIPHILKTLRYREMGVQDRRGSDSLVRQALLKNKNRVFTPGSMLHKRGKMVYDERWTYSRNQHTLYNMDSGAELPLPPIKNIERVVAELFFGPGITVDPPEHPPHQLILLTDIGRLLFFDIRSQVFSHVYQLPAHAYKFRDLHWNKYCHEICVTGHTMAPQKATIAVFSLTPVKFKYLFSLDKQIFCNAQDAVVTDDVLVCFCNNPNRLVMFDMAEIYRTTCMDTDEPLGSRIGKVTLTVNLNITEEPKKLMQIMGQYQCAHFGCNSFVLLEPKSASVKYSLRDIRDINIHLVHKGTGLPTRDDAGSFLSDVSVMCGYSDFSSRILRIEGIHLVSYDISRPSESETCEIREGWRTALVPPVPEKPLTSRVVTTSSGRVVRHIEHDEEGHAHFARITDIRHSDDHIVVTVIYDAMTFDFFNNTGDNSDSVWISLVFLLNEMTGRIEKVVGIQNSLRAYPLNIKFEPDFRHQTILEDDLLATLTFDRSRSSLSIYRLSELTDEEEHVDINRINYKPTVMSKKKLRQVARNARQSNR